MNGKSKIGIVLGAVVSLGLMTYGVARMARAEALTMTMLGEAAAGNAAQETEEQLAARVDPIIEAVGRIRAIWKELVGTLPAGEPRFNAQDIGHVVECATKSPTLRATLTATLKFSMKRNGIEVPKDADEATFAGELRFLDLDDNGGKARRLSGPKLRALSTDLDEVQGFINAVFLCWNDHRPPQPQGLSVRDWDNVEGYLKAAKKDGNFGNLHTSLRIGRFLRLIP